MKPAITLEDNFMPNRQALPKMFSQGFKSQEQPQNLSFLPSIFQQKIKAGLEETSVIKGGQEWIKSNKPFWLVLGGIGCGKSLGAIKTGLDLMNAGFTDRAGNHVKYEPFERVKASAVQAECQANANYLNNSRLLKSWLLILEELGGEHIPAEKSYWFSKLDFLLDERYEHQKKTIIVCNYTLETMKSIYPERFIDRLKGMCLITEASEGSLR